MQFLAPKRQKFMCYPNAKVHVPFIQACLETGISHPYRSALKPTPRRNAKKTVILICN
jgi:hypothetical protein